jgi:hypothetical protein
MGLCKLKVQIIYGPRMILSNRDENKMVEKTMGEGRFIKSHIRKVVQRKYLSL